MKLYSENKDYKLYNGNMLDLLQVVEENTVDSIVTDPPYELNFMSKSWDNSGIAFQKETWEQCYKALKPGGYLLAFGGTRTFHRIACAIEDAGFEIRDTIMWLYGSGMPKSMNIGLAIDKKNGVDNRTGNIVKGQGVKDNTKNIMHLNCNEQYEERVAQNEWNGWGTCLKPSYEPIIVARKPVEKSIVENVMKYGVGGINIDECRVGNEIISTHNAPKGTFAGGDWDRGSDISSYKQHSGRFPANTILTYDETDYEEVCGNFPISGSGNGGVPYNYAGREYNNKNTSMFNGDKPQAPSNYNDNGSASRYFYCAKASKKDRDEGLDALNLTQNGGNRKENGKSILENPNISKKNIHPTVKPTELMQYLVRLVTPKNGTILDPFNGSGSTGKAVMYENLERNINYKYIGIELTEEYLPIAKARIEYVCELPRRDKEKASLMDLLEETEEC